MHTFPHEWASAILQGIKTVAGAELSSDFELSFANAGVTRENLKTISLCRTRVMLYMLGDIVWNPSPNVPTEQIDAIQSKLGAWAVRVKNDDKFIAALAEADCAIEHLQVFQAFWKQVACSDSSEAALKVAVPPPSDCGGFRLGSTSVIAVSNAALPDPTPEQERAHANVEEATAGELTLQSLYAFTGDDTQVLPSIDVHAPFAMCMKVSLEALLWSFYIDGVPEPSIASAKYMGSISGTIFTPGLIAIGRTWLVVVLCALRTKSLSLWLAASQLRRLRRALALCSQSEPEDKSCISGSITQQEVWQPK